MLKMSDHIFSTRYKKVTCENYDIKITLHRYREHDGLCDICEKMVYIKC